MHPRVEALIEGEAGLPRPVIGELWYMVLNSTRVSENRVLLEQILNELSIWEFDDAACREFGAIRVELRKLGRPIPQIDTQIAAIARVNDLTLLTADRHFSSIQGLKTENWL